MFKIILGFLMMAAGLVLGLYVGIWLCLIGGVVQGIEAAKATPMNSLGIAVGIARVLLSSAAGGTAAFALILPGAGIIASAK